MPWALLLSMRFPARLAPISLEEIIMSTEHARRLTACIVAAGVAVLAACNDGPSPTASTPAPKFGAPNLAVAGTIVNNTAVASEFRVCKEGNVAGTFTVTRTNLNSTGFTIASSPVIVAAGTCVVVLEDDSPSDQGSNVTVTEVPATELTGLVGVTADNINPATQTPIVNPQNGATYFINSIHGVRLTFTNTHVEPPPCDFITFGGAVLLPNNISYGGNAGITSLDVLFGELDFVDHTNGNHYHVHDITKYTHPTTGPLSQFPETRLVEGLATLNGDGSHPLSVRLTDLGEPGTNDRIWLSVDGQVLIPAMVVDDGNIQLHDLCRPAPLPKE
jgi:hypothetical protein